MTSILIQENNQADMKPYLDLLQSSKYEVETAVEFEQGLKLYQARPPDVSIINITGLTDEQVYKVLELRNSRPEGKLIAVTINTDEGKPKYQDRVDTLMAEGMLLKPIKSEEFQKIMMEVLFRKSRIAVPDKKAAAEAERKKRLENSKVLVVEDSKTAQKMYEMYVSNSEKLNGLRLVNAGTAEDGLRILLDGEFQLIILDWELPGMNGLDFLKQVRANSRFDNIKIIMSTSVNKKPKIIQAISQGVNDYIIKPVNVQNFISKIIANLDI